MAILTRKPESEEERRRKLLTPFIPEQPVSQPEFLAPSPMTRQPPMAPIESPEIAPAEHLITRETQPLNYIPPEPYVVRNNKGRPTGAEGGFDQLSRNQVLLEAQRNYKAPLSWKDIGLSMLRGFIGGGVPGAAVGAIDYGLNQDTRNAYAVGGDMRRTQGAIDSDLTRQRVDSQMAEQKAHIEALQRKPLDDASKLMEQERDNIRQIYNAQPYFDPAKNPQHKAIAERAARLGLTLPDRDEKDDSQLEWVNGSLQRVSRSGRRPTATATDATGQPLVRQSEIPVVEDGLTVTPGQALTYRGQIADKTGRGEAERRKYLTDRDTAFSRAEGFKKELQGIDAELGKAPSYEPTYKDGMPVTDEKGNILYGTQVSARRRELLDRRSTVQRNYEEAIDQANRAHSQAEGVYVPSPSTSQPYAGRTMSAANLVRYAKDKGISEAEARKQVEAQGVRVQ